MALVLTLAWSAGSPGPSPSTGWIAVESEGAAGADIWLDGRLTNFVTPATERTSPGRHQLEARKALHEGSQSVEVKTGDVVKVSLGLTPSAGELSVTTERARRGHRAGRREGGQVALEQRPGGQGAAQRAGQPGRPQARREGHHRGARQEGPGDAPASPSSAGSRWRAPRARWPGVPGRGRAGARADRPEPGSLGPHPARDPGALQALRARADHPPGRDREGGRRAEAGPRQPEGGQRAASRAASCWTAGRPGPRPPSSRPRPVSIWCGWRPRTVPAAAARPASCSRWVSAGSCAWCCPCARAAC
ncbi:MAG: hypothetical protein MZW92_06220 [Comamonadaceae bacterium]|nr:hypothetical protein [Comamonadaceae bacterium]